MMVDLFLRPLYTPVPFAGPCYARVAVAREVPIDDLGGLYLGAPRVRPQGAWTLRTRERRALESGLCCACSGEEPFASLGLLRFPLNCVVSFRALSRVVHKGMNSILAAFRTLSPAPSPAPRHHRLGARGAGRHRRRCRPDGLRAARSHAARGRAARGRAARQALDNHALLLVVRVPHGHQASSGQRA